MGRQCNISDGSKRSRDAKRAVDDKQNKQLVAQQAKKKASWRDCKNVWVAKTPQGIKIPEGSHMKVVSALFRADAVVVPSIAEAGLEKRVTDSNGEMQDVLPLHTLAARVLGLRLCTPEFLEVTKFPKLPRDVSIVYGPLFKQKANYIWVTSHFEKSHPKADQLLRHACSLKGSKWKLLKNEAGYVGFSTKNKNSTWKVDHYADLNSIVRASPPQLCKVRSSRGTFPKSTHSLIVR